MIAPGQVWRDASGYIPGYGQVTVIEVVRGRVVFERFVGWTQERCRMPMPMKKFVERFKRVEP